MVGDIESSKSADARPSTAEGRLGRRVIAWTRFIAIIPVLGLLVGSVTLVVSAGLKTITTVGKAFSGTYDSKDLLVSFIEVADVFLLGIVLYIIALGIFELFVDDRLPLPVWLEFHHLDDLEVKLVGVVAVVLTVYFLGQVIQAPLAQSRDIMMLGVGIGALLAAVGLFLWAMSRVKKG